MIAFRREAMQLMERLPEEKFPYLIQYIRELEIETPTQTQEITPKMKAFMELEHMNFQGFYYYINHFSAVDHSWHLHKPFIKPL